MPKDSDDREDHPGEIAVRVPHEHLCGIPIVPPECETDSYEGEKQVKTKKVGICGRMRIWS